MATINEVNSGMTVGAKGEVVMTRKPMFLAYLDAAVSNVTGDATVYTITYDTEEFDIDSNFNTGTYTFTAPVTGKYTFHYSIMIRGITASHTLGVASLVTSNSAYDKTFNPSKEMDTANSILSISDTVFCDMDASDTAYVTLTISNGTKVNDIDGTITDTQFSGFLVC